MNLNPFFELNREILEFCYGLAFFVLGFAILLQVRSHSRLELARSLPWLGAFGVTHSLNEWGDVFIPVQAAYLDAYEIAGLKMIQLGFLAISFGCLFEFGMVLIRPARRIYLFHPVTGALLLGWLAVSFLILLPLTPNSGLWYRQTNALARYAICFPGGLLAAYGLRRHALVRIARLNAPHIVSTLRVAGIALGLYALFAGLIPPPIPIFPGSWLNTKTFQATIGVPAILFRALIGLAMAIAIIRALEIFELETARFVEAMEQKQILATERERIARELHDGVIQKVYTAGLLVQSAENQIASENPVKARLKTAAVVLNDAIADLRRNLGELRATKSQLALPDALRQLTQDSRFQSLVDISLELDLPADEPLSPSRVNDVLAIVNEALSNVIRHARAGHVVIAARRVNGRLVLTIQDDGIGLPKNLVEGYGMRNMRDRARLLGGEIRFEHPASRGTTIELNVPWRDER